MRWNWIIFWGAAGVGMLVSGFWLDWFVVNLTLFRINIGWLACLYASLLTYRNVRLQTEIRMTERELHDWGERLAEATPRILDLAEQGKRPRDIAALLCKEQGIPELVSLKYMVALSREVRQDSRSDGSRVDEVQHEVADRSGHEQ